MLCRPDMEARFGLPPILTAETGLRGPRRVRRSPLPSPLHKHLLCPMHVPSGFLVKPCPGQCIMYLTTKTRRPAGREGGDVSSDGQICRQRLDAAAEDNILRTV